jgi:hypothetical protein
MSTTPQRGGRNVARNRSNKASVSQDVQSRILGAIASGVSCRILCDQQRPETPQGQERKAIENKFGILKKLKQRDPAAFRTLYSEKDDYTTPTAEQEEECTIPSGTIHCYRPGNQLKCRICERIVFAKSFHRHCTKNCAGWPRAVKRYNKRKEEEEQEEEEEGLVNHFKKCVNWSEADDASVLPNGASDTSDSEKEERRHKVARLDNPAERLAKTACTVQRKAKGSSLLEQVMKKRANRKDCNPKAATRLRTTPPEDARAQAAALAPVDDDGDDDVGVLLDTFLSKLLARKVTAVNSEDDDVCEKGVDIKKMITLIENGRAELNL